MDLGKYLKEKKRLDPERALSYALDIARYSSLLHAQNFTEFKNLKLKLDLKSSDPSFYPLIHLCYNFVAESYDSNIVCPILSKQGNELLA